MTPAEFAAKWKANTTKEIAGSKEQFIDLLHVNDRFKCPGRDATESRWMIGAHGGLTITPGAVLVCPSRRQEMSAPWMSSRRCSSRTMLSSNCLGW